MGERADESKVERGKEPEEVIALFKTKAVFFQPKSKLEIAADSASNAPCRCLKQISSLVPPFPALLPQ